MTGWITDNNNIIRFNPFVHWNTIGFQVVWGTNCWWQFNESLACSIPASSMCSGLMHSMFWLQPWWWWQQRNCQRDCIIGRLPLGGILWRIFHLQCGGDRANQMYYMGKDLREWKLDGGLFVGFNFSAIIKFTDTMMKTKWWAFLHRTQQLKWNHWEAEFCWKWHKKVTKTS